MSDNVPAEEIADDFRHSLEYLQNPDRYAINNFTVIAKENTEHADAISNVLIEHIRKAPPHHKLPGLYVLDSIAKNIGTPYSLFLGHKLYSAFMGAYSSVDPTTRKKLDEMLKTWKSPVPGSIDPTPVFPPEITKRIENALIQARTVALKHDQTQNQSAFQKRPNSALAATQWRNTPTPPAQNLQFTPPLLHSQHAVTQAVPYGVSVSQNNLSALPRSSTTPLLNPFYSQENCSNPISIYNNTVLSTPPPFLNAQGGQLHLKQYGQVPSHLNDMNVLHHDIDRLIESCRHGYSFGYTEQQRSSKLQALVALKEVLSTQSLPSEQLVVVRRQVDELQAIERRENSEKQTVSTPPPFSFAAPAPPSNFSSTPLPARIASGIEAFSTSGPATPNLAALLARVTAEPPAHSLQPKAPTMVQGGSDHESTAGMSSLLASLAEQGVFLQIEGEKSRDSDTRSSTTIPNGSVADLLARATKSNSDANEVPLKLSSSSLKLARPDRLKTMLQKRPSQCVNCGLRFTSTDDGKQRKEQHMDWHFQANQRISDAAKGIQSRSWFVGELEWIKSKELENQSQLTMSGVHDEAQIKAKKTSISRYVSVPSDPEAHQPCPICQERFDTGFNQDIQDWVWLDAVRVGAKIYHATCFADLKRDGSEMREKTATPESILGKRKAESLSTDRLLFKKAVLSVQSEALSPV